MINTLRSLTTGFNEIGAKESAAPKIEVPTVDVKKAAAKAKGAASDVFERVQASFGNSEETTSLKGTGNRNYHTFS